MTNVWRQPEPGDANGGSLSRFINEDAVLDNLADPSPDPAEQAEHRQRQQYALHFFDAMVRMACHSEASPNAEARHTQARWQLRVQVLHAETEGKTPEAMAAALGRSRSTIYQVRLELRIIVPFLNEWLDAPDISAPLPPHYQKVLNRLCRGQTRKEIIDETNLSPKLVDNAYRYIRQSLEQSFQHYLDERQRYLRERHRLLRFFKAVDQAEDQDSNSGEGETCPHST
jgi:hypothetical protein